MVKIARRMKAATMDPETTHGIWMPGEVSLGGGEVSLGGGGEVSLGGGKTVGTFETTGVGDKSRVLVLTGV